MNKGILHTCFFFLLLIWMEQASFAQRNSVLNLKEDVLRLKEAEELFEKGLFEEAKQKTELVMNSKELTHSEREQVLIITAKINLELDKIDEVNQNIVTLLRTNPNYVLNPVIVQQDLYNYYKHYYVIPKLSFSILGNYNIPLISGTNQYSLLRDVNYGASYKQSPSYGGGLDLTYTFRKNFFISAGFSYNQYGYSRKLTGQDGLEISYSEALSFNEIPVMVGKRFAIMPDRKLFITFMAQASMMKVLSAKSDITIKYPVYSKDNSNNSQEKGEMAERGIDRKGERQDMNTFGFNLEFNKKISNLMISIGGSYRVSDQMLNNPDRRYSNERLIYTYNYIDNDFQMDLRQVYLKLNYTFKYSIKYRQIKETAAKNIVPEKAPESLPK